MHAIMATILVIGICLCALGLFTLIMSVIESLRCSRDATRFYKRMQYDMSNPASREEYERVMSNYRKATSSPEDAA